MKKLYSMICICGLIVAMVGMMGIRPAISQEIVCQEVEVDVKPGRINTIRLDSRSWVPIVIFSDTDAGFNAANIDPNTVTINGEYVQPLGAMLLDRNRDGSKDLLLFYIANKLNLTEDDIVEGEIEITVKGDFVVDPEAEDEEVISCFEGTDTVGCATSRFNFGSNFGTLRDRWNSRRGQ